MKRNASSLQGQFNAWLIRIGTIRGILLITGISVALSVFVTGATNAVFMPDERLEEWLYIAIAAPAVISPLVSWVVLSLLHQLYETKTALAVLSETDLLTGVGNRRYFVNRARQAAYEAARSGISLCVILIDIDHFKRLNDTYGHAAGDDALVAVADVCRRSLRASVNSP